MQQPQESLLLIVFKALENHPTKNDWLNGAKEILEEFEIELSFKQIQTMKTTQYKSLVKKKASKAAFKYLIQKQENGKKGRLIKYKQIEMVDYLLPECSLTVSDKTELFAFRCEINDLPNNFGKSEMCEFSCQEEMNNEHLLSCAHLNKGQLHKLEMGNIRNGNILETVEVLKKLQENSGKN